ncbi:hypothetical protein JW921_07070 [Candidatus Fermentibacterales bacterium]|nr:hypothetical protein [Candidatus Fermentibacterales bacterium]
MSGPDRLEKRAEIGLVCVKATDLPRVSRDVSRWCDRALVLTNGMGLEELWGPGWSGTVDRCVTTAGFLLSEGTVTACEGLFYLDRQSPGFAVLEPALPPGAVVRVLDIEPVLWAKWLVNSTINPLAALAGCRNDKLSGSPLGPIVRDVLRELEEVVPPGPRSESSYIARGMLDSLLSASSNLCSMLQDLRAGRTTEIDQLTGYRPPGSEGREAPLAEALTELVRAAQLRGLPAAAAHPDPVG